MTPRSTFRDRDQDPTGEFAKAAESAGHPAGHGCGITSAFSTEPASRLGGAAGFRDVLGGVKSGFLNFLDYPPTMMKARRRVLT